MFRRIIDDILIENETPTCEEGLGFIDDDIIFQKEKILQKGEFEIFGKKVKGFQIRHGQSAKYPLFYEKNNIKGTFVHGIFDDEKFKQYKQKTINEFVNIVKEKIDTQKILNAL